jgi:hypothetical protein
MSASALSSLLRAASASASSHSSCSCGSMDGWRRRRYRCRASSAYGHQSPAGGGRKSRTSRQQELLAPKEHSRGRQAGRRGWGDRHRPARCDNPFMQGRVCRAACWMAASQPPSLPPSLSAPVLCSAVCSATHCWQACARTRARDGIQPCMRNHHHAPQSSAKPPPHPFTPPSACCPVHCEQLPPTQAEVDRLPNVKAVAKATVVGPREGDHIVARLLHSPTHTHACGTWLDGCRGAGR